MQVKKVINNIIMIIEVSFILSNAINIICLCHSDVSCVFVQLATWAVISSVSVWNSDISFLIISCLVISIFIIKQENYSCAKCMNTLFTSDNVIRRNASRVMPLWKKNSKFREKHYFQSSFTLQVNKIPCCIWTWDFWVFFVKVKQRNVTF